MGSCCSRCSSCHPSVSGSSFDLRLAFPSFYSSLAAHPYDVKSSPWPVFSYAKSPSALPLSTSHVARGLPRACSLAWSPAFLYWGVTPLELDLMQDQLVILILQRLVMMMTKLQMSQLPRELGTLGPLGIETTFD